MQFVQMVQSSCQMSLLIACRAAAFPLLTLLMHQPVVFLLQSERVTAHAKQNWARAHVRDDLHQTHNKLHMADGMQRANKSFIRHEL